MTSVDIVNLDMLGLSDELGLDPLVPAGAVCGADGVCVIPGAAEQIAAQAATDAASHPDDTTDVDDTPQAAADAR